MTDVRVAKNRWRYFLILAMTLVALGVLVWAVAYVRNTDQNGFRVGPPADIEEDSAVSSTASPFEDYLGYVRAVEDRQRHDPASSADVVEGLRKFAGALGTLGLGSPDLQVTLRVAAEHVAINQGSAAATPVVRDGLIAAADAIAREHSSGPVDLRMIAESIEPDEPLADQHPTIDDFFRESATALQRLSPSP